MSRLILSVNDFYTFSSQTGYHAAAQKLSPIRLGLGFRVHEFDNVGFIPPKTPVDNSFYLFEKQNQLILPIDKRNENFL